MSGQNSKVGDVEIVNERTIYNDYGGISLDEIEEEAKRGFRSNNWPIVIESARILLETKKYMLKKDKFLLDQKKVQLEEQKLKSRN